MKRRGESLENPSNKAKKPETIIFTCLNKIKSTPISQSRQISKKTSIHSLHSTKSLKVSTKEYSTVTSRRNQCRRRRTRKHQHSPIIPNEKITSWMHFINVPKMLYVVKIFVSRKKRELMELNLIE